MQITSKPAAILASSALAASVILGGAGVANAQGSLDSLTGSLNASDVELTVAGSEDGLAGEITNNTEEPLACDVTVLDAEVMELVESSVAEGDTLADALDGAAESTIDDGADNVAVAAGESVPWAGSDDSYDAETAPDAGAVADCGEEMIVFAYESSGLLGSLDMGSLGS